MKRHGFALVAVAWLIVAASALGVVATLAARDAVQASRNRVALTRAAWLAEGCAERVRAALDAELRSGGAWRELGARETRAAGCEVRLRPAGLALDVNVAGKERLVGTLGAAGVAEWTADSLAEALLDWRDSDSIARPAGAEASWYARNGRLAPRNGALTSPLELEQIRGFETLRPSDSLLGVEPGRTPINLAPMAVIASLPGVTPELAARLAERRSRGDPLTSLMQLGEGLSRRELDSLRARFAELAAQATVEPEAWILTVRVADGQPPVVVTYELRLVHAARRAAIVRRRSW